jgi:hypothetical protein
MTDKLLALLSLALLLGFLGIVVVFVNDPNLWAGILLVLYQVPLITTDGPILGARLT